MRELIERIRLRLGQGSYSNEAAVSHGVVTPLLGELGWDSADPDQLVPEFSSGRGRVDFALLGRARRPSVFIEVKGVGRSLEGDRQLFEYAFHEGVPICVLTDGREWSFYLPSGQGSYDDRRVYRLQLDDREPAECERVLMRYLSRDRVRSGAAFEDAQRDYRDAAGRREATESIPKAWSELVSESEDLLLELVADRAEALSGFRPIAQDVAAFLQSLRIGGTAEIAKRAPLLGRTSPVQFTDPSLTQAAERSPVADKPSRASAGTRAVRYFVLGNERTASNANIAFVDILQSLATGQPDKIEALAAAVQGRSRNHIARSVEEIYPARPDLARAEEFAPGWLVGLNIANREKMAITRTACDIFDVVFGKDIILDLPNAT